MTEQHVPFVDLKLAHARVAAAVSTGFAGVLESAAYVLGAPVETFEREYAAFCGVQECVGVGNGTDAVELALRALGVGAGDEVVVPANTFVATAEAVVHTGATLVLADATEDHLLDVASVKERLTPRTRAVVGVHLYGQMAQVEELRAILPDDVLVVEDAAQSQGARRHGARSGSVGDAAATSFYPGKNLGAYGDAGAVTTPDAEVAARIRAMRNHGGVRRYEHELLGLNSRLDSLQAVVLSAKLAVLDAWNHERREAADRYHELLAGVSGITLPRTVPGNEHVWHLYVIECEDRDRIESACRDAGIGVGIHYPTPIHLLPPFAGLGYRAGDFPVAERAARRILSLPMFPGITVEQQERVAAAIGAR